MDGRRLTSLGVACCMCGALAACGGDDDDGDRGLTRAVHATCGTEEFARPRTSELTPAGSDRRSWRVEYRRNRPPRPGQTQTVLIIEVASSIAPPKPAPGSENLVIAGRRVSFRSPAPTAPGFAAQWRTERAFYTLVADGKQPATVRKFISCLP
jgi:hypothetical protein